MVDMFPHTPHIETVVLITKNNIDTIDKKIPAYCLNYNDGNFI